MNSFLRLLLGSYKLPIVTIGYTRWGLSSNRGFNYGITFFVKQASIGKGLEIHLKLLISVLMALNDWQYFDSLMREIYFSTFGEETTGSSISYSEREMISDKIEENTGLRISGKSIQTYYKNILAKEGNQKLPLLSTLDILARYVLGAKPIKPSERKNDFSFWIKYKESKNQKAEKTTQTTKAQYFIISIASIGLIIFTTVCWAIFKLDSQSEEYYQRFDSSDLDYLINIDWFLMGEKRLDLWGRNDSSGYLTLETFEGDSWLDDTNYEPVVRNILARKIECGNCCEVIVKLVNFTPLERYQQAGLFLFFSNPGVEVPSVRYSLVGVDGLSRLSGVFRKEYRVSKPLLHDKESNRIDLADTTKENSVHRIDSVCLRLKVSGNTYSFSRKVNNESYISVKTMDLPIQNPTHIGLTSFQGYPLVPPVIPIADTIDAHFESIHIFPCNE